MLFSLFSQAVHKAKTHKKDCIAEGGECNSHWFKKKKQREGYKVQKYALALLYLDFFSVVPVWISGRVEHG